MLINVQITFILIITALMPPLDKLFLLIAIIALPNLFYRAEYNVPVFIFCFALWHSTTHKSTILYILILSWLIDIFSILKTISIVTESDSLPTLVLIIQVIVFFLKVTTSLWRLPPLFWWLCLTPILDQPLCPKTWWATCWAHLFRNDMYSWYDHMFVSNCLLCLKSIRKIKTLF